MTQREAFEAWWGQAPVELQPLQPRTREDTLSALVWEAWQAAQAAQPARQVPTTNYVQPVPDHCDRITWRNRYYHLPLAAELSAARAVVKRVQRIALIDPPHAGQMLEIAAAIAAPIPPAQEPLTDATKASCALGYEECSHRCGTPHVCCDHYVEPEPIIEALQARVAELEKLVEVNSSIEKHLRANLDAATAWLPQIDKLRDQAAHWEMTCGNLTAGLKRKDALLRGCIGIMNSGPYVDAVLVRGAIESINKELT